jgi:beta-N-acetylhexosaminidase
MNRTNNHPTRRDVLRLASCAALASSAWAADDAEATRRWVEEHLKTLSLAERVGQVLLMHAKVDDFETHLAEGHVGSLQVPRGPTTRARDVVGFINRVQKSARTPLLTMGSVEQGMGQVVIEGTLVPNNMAIGATGSEELAYRAARVHAVEARALGVTWPGVAVADVNTNPRNPIISTRSFGDSPELVSRFLVAAIRAVSELRLISNANHFPGHGATSEDSHLVLPTVSRTRGELKTIDLPPFIAAIKAGVATMCTAHICYPALEPTKGLPATMSARILTDLLRRQLGFQGFVHGDSFAMDAIRNNFSVEDAAVRTFRAGCDVLLSYPDSGVCFRALLQAAEKDADLRTQLDTSVRRILTWKHRVGLAQFTPIDLEQCLQVLGRKEHHETVLEVARRAVTIVRGGEFVRSLRDRENVLAIVGQTRYRLGPNLPHAELVSRLRAALPRMPLLEIAFEPTPAEVQAAEDQATRSDAILFAGFTQVRSRDPDSVGFPRKQVELVRRLAARKPTIVVSFGTPYALGAIDSAAALVCAFDAVPACLQAAVEVLTAERPATGHMPVKLSAI